MISKICFCFTSFTFVFTVFISSVIPWIIIIVFTLVELGLGGGHSTELKASGGFDVQQVTNLAETKSYSDINPGSHPLRLKHSGAKLRPYPTTLT